nr:hypothetical protein [uncultured Desulfovibrio sp.]
MVSDDVTLVAATYTGHKKSLGTFTNGAGAGLGETMGNGLILSSGNVLDADSPPSGTVSSSMNTAGDFYLETGMGSHAGWRALMRGHRIRKTVLPCLAAGLLFLAFCTEFFASAGVLVASRGYFIPKESSLFTFHVTQDNTGNGEYWL